MKRPLGSRPAIPDPSYSTQRTSCMLTLTHPLREMLPSLIHTLTVKKSPNSVYFPDPGNPVPTVGLNVRTTLAKSRFLKKVKNPFQPHRKKNGRKTGSNRKSLPGPPSPGASALTERHTRSEKTPSTANPIFPSHSLFHVSRIGPQRRS